jgi:RNA polymerase sigma factor (TIGR02999 family)
MHAQGTVTVLLRQARCGDRSAFDEVIGILYPELRRMARRQIRGENNEHILQPTALVNEAYLRLVSQREHNWENRIHFLGAASQVMRRILVDQARARMAQKRTGDAAALPAEELGLERAREILSLDEALLDLEKMSPRQLRVVELRHFGGLTVPEIADLLGVTPRTVDRDWAAARAWLRRRLRG